MRILARLLGIGYLGWIVFNEFIGVPAEEMGMHPVARMAIIVVFLGVAALLLVGSILEVARNVKAGYYNASYHTDDAGVVGAAPPEDVDNSDAPGDDDEDAAGEKEANESSDKSEDQ